MNKLPGKDPMEVLGCGRGSTHEELLQNLPRHKDYFPDLLRQVKRIPEVILRNSGTPLAKKINKMMREVSTESYRAIQFTRTEINNRGVLYGVVLLKHRVIDLVLKYFHERFGSRCIICLYNEVTKVTAIMNEKGKIRILKVPLMKIVQNLSKSRSIIPYFDDIQFTGEEIFETLYNSQFISERENKKYFQKMIPDKCFELPGMRGGVEKSFRNKKINDFF